MFPKKRLVILVAGLLLSSVLFLSFIVHPSQTVHAAATTCPRTLTVGSTGDDVIYLQNDLNFFFYQKILPNSPYDFHPYLNEDGKFGQLTENAVLDFQIARHLKIDGIVGPQTWHALQEC